MKGYDRASKQYSEKQRGMGLGYETISLVSHHMTYKPPQADSPESYDHVCTLQSFHGAVAAPLSEVPQEGSYLFSLFSLIKLYLASPPLASSYSRVTVSSICCAPKIYISGPSVWGPVKGNCELGQQGLFSVGHYAEVVFFSWLRIIFGLHDKVPSRRGPLTFLPLCDHGGVGI